MSFETPTYPGINLDDNYGPTLVAVGVAFTVISAATVVLRFISRTCTRIDIERDDWLLLAAAIFCWAYNAVIMVEADQNFYGQHIGKSDAHHLSEYLKGLYSLAVVYPLALTLSKLSLLALYWRIFRNSSAKRPIQIVAALNIAWMIAAVLVGLFSCNPVRGFWDLTIPSTCIQEYNFFLTNECLTIVLDLIVLIIPLWSIAQIQRSLSQRIAIGSTFALGLGVTVVSAIRLWQLVEAQKRPGNDPTFNQTGAALWAIVEVNTWVVVASIPALRPLVHEVGERYEKSRAARSKSKGSLTLVPSAESRSRKSGSKHSNGKVRIGKMWWETARPRVPGDEKSASRQSLAGRGAGHGGVVPGGMPPSPGQGLYSVQVSSAGTSQPQGHLQNGLWGTEDVELGRVGDSMTGMDSVEMGRIRVQKQVYVGP